jgi:hypothetical protein
MGWSIEGLHEDLWRLTPILDVRRPERSECGVPTVEVALPDRSDGTRWRALAQLDILLDQLERATLHGETEPPQPAVDALRRLGLGDVDRYCAVELVDIVLHAQWSLSSGAAPSIDERQALVREARCLWEQGTIWETARDPAPPRAAPPNQLAADGQL